VLKEDLVVYKAVRDMEVLEQEEEEKVVEVEVEERRSRWIWWRTRR